MPEQLGPALWSWASHLEPQAREQALRSSRMPFIAGHIALMPDAHFGLGATVGSVIPTDNAIMPAAVGVDIGCGMIAVATSLTAAQLPDDLSPYLSQVEQVVPAGVGQGHAEATKASDDFFALHPPFFSDSLLDRARRQFGSLGSGNHFFEVCLDESDGVWVVLHSGSRGVGNQLAQRHINTAKARVKAERIDLEDPDLAYFEQGSDDFAAYIADMMWCQDYARANRDAMMDAALRAFFAFVGAGRQRTRIKCHHNFTEQESFGGRLLWITRKGAIKADAGRLGVIPGSMGTQSYIVEGKGSTLAWNSCAHGAGRAMSRSEAKRRFTTDDLIASMGDRVWLHSKADALLDEIPMAYKSIDAVMEDQKDLVEVKAVLRQVLNYKGA